MCSGQELDMFHLFTYSEVSLFSADGCDKIMNDMSTHTHTNIENTTAQCQQVFFLSGARPFGFSRSNTGPTKMGAVDSSRNLSFFFFHFKREKQQISLIIFVFL